MGETRSEKLLEREIKGLKRKAALLRDYMGQETTARNDGAQFQLNKTLKNLAEKQNALDKLKEGKIARGLRLH
jgi:hypothetical protein